MIPLADRIRPQLLSELVQREKVRRIKNFQKPDQLRNQIKKLGY